MCVKDSNYNWAATRQNLSSVCPRKKNSNQFTQLQRLASYHTDLYIFVTVSQVTIFYSSLDTFINTNTKPKGGAPAQAEYTSKKERKNARK